MSPTCQPSRWKIVLAALIVALASSPSVAAQANRPNLMILLADDLGDADLGFQGYPEIPTLNLDSLARPGVRCTNGYVAGPSCSPTRESRGTLRALKSPARPVALGPGSRAEAR